MNENKETVEDHRDNEEVTPISEPISPEIEPMEASADADGHDKLQAELADTKDRFVRLFAEFDNYRKRTQKERIELLRSASAEVVISLLPVLDDFERAQKFANEVDEDQSRKEGIGLVYTKFKSILEAKGLKRMNSIGEIFDVELHEAITNIPSPTPEMKGKVVDEAECGYFLNEKVIRHAKVIVGN